METIVFVTDVPMLAPITIGIACLKTVQLTLEKGNFTTGMSLNEGMLIKRF
jgi:hypothetical protein